MITHLTFLILCILMSPLGAEEPAHELAQSSLVSTTGLISTMVDGSVCAISGEYIDSQTDLVLPGPEPIMLRRTYSSMDTSSKDPFISWHFSNPTKIKFRHNGMPGHIRANEYSVSLSETSGAKILYTGIRNNSPKWQDLQFENPIGLTNCGEGEISARTNLKNQKLSVGKKWTTCKVQGPAGDMRYFLPMGKEYTQRNSWDEYQDFKLIREQRLNGNQLHYSYDIKNPEKMVATDSSGEIVYSWLNFDYPSKKDDLTVKSSDGRSVFYRFKKIKDHGSNHKYYLTGVIRPDKPNESYEYSNKAELCLLSRKERPEGRFQAIDYYSSGKNIVDKYATLKFDADDPRVDRVKQLSAPVGADRKPVVTHSFLYTLNVHENKVLNGYTDVLDAYGHKTTYHYNEDHRPFAIERHAGNWAGGTQRYSWEGYIWRDDRLISKYLKDANHQVYYARTFHYDDPGNIKVEYFYGNLSGEGDVRYAMDQEPEILYNCEHYAHCFTYSQDGLNLVLTEHEDNDKELRYSYKPGTDLITSRILRDRKRGTLLRQFYDYDNCGVVIQVITDNGTTEDRNDLSGVSERHITHITTRKIAPIGLPEQIDECDVNLQTGEELLTKKTLSEYSKEGRLLKQNHYDCNGEFIYSHSWDYDAHGNVILEINPLGQEIERKYDANDNLIYEKNRSLSYHTVNTYDYSNRLIKSEEIHDDGSQFVTSHRYNYLSQRVATVDSFGNETQYHYDEFGRVIQTIYPTVFTDMVTNPYTLAGYDIAGNQTLSVDARGKPTTTAYNARGKPIRVVRPNGTTERFIYYKDGTLREAITPNGTRTCYARDVLGRVTSQETYSKAGELLGTTSATYNAYHLLSSTDAEGTTTDYKYDFRGRLIETTTAGRSTQFQYDSQGRLERKIQNAEVVNVCAYDLLDRIIEERLEEMSGKVHSKTTYAYDAAGNCTLVAQETDAGRSVTLTEYNSRNQPTKITDALGNVTHITYDYRYRNALGQFVLQVTSTDPLGNLTISTYDALGKVVDTMRKNPMGMITAHQELFYDAHGNCIKIIDHVLLNGELQRQITTALEYNDASQLVRQCEAKGTPEQKITYYTYNEYGQKSAQTKPDGVEVRYTYDANGLLQRFQSTDESFACSYTYDKNHLPIVIKDLKNGTETHRKYDAFGAMIGEKLNNDLALSYSYDKLGRLKTVTLPDNTGVSYGYDASALRTVSRIVNGKTQYSHNYDEFDLSGALKSMTLPKNAGKVTFDHDLLSRQIAMTAPGIKQTEMAYDAVGNLLGYNYADAIAKTDYKFTYDDLYQLTSETGPAPHTYASDSLNNRVIKDTAPYQLNSLNQLLSQTDCKYTYDLNGNLIKRIRGNEVTDYQYDALDRLIAVTGAGRTVTYDYDAFNRRLSKTTYDGVTNYFYVEQCEIGAWENGEITELRLLGLGKGAEIGAAVALELNNQFYVPLHDHNGNVTALLDAGGQTIETYRYTAFGEETIFDINGDQLHSSSVGNTWRFASKRQDPETGFVYFGRRYYAPDIGRWITPDPLGFDDGPNLYAYVRNNPLTHVDLYGLERDGGEAREETTIIQNNSGREKNDAMGSDRFENRNDRQSRERNSTSVESTFSGTWEDYKTGVWEAWHEPSWTWSDTLEQANPFNLKEPRSDARMLGRAAVAAPVAVAAVAATIVGAQFWGPAGAYVGAAMATRWGTAGAAAAVISNSTNARQAVNRINTRVALLRDKVSNFFGRDIAKVATNLQREVPRNVTMDKVKNETSMLAEKTLDIITGYTKHGLDQAIGRDNGKGVAIKAILDAVRNPMNIIQQANGRVKYVGQNASVVLNSSGKVITVFGKNRGPAIWNNNQVIQPTNTKN